MINVPKVLYDCFDRIKAKLPSLSHAFVSIGFKKQTLIFWL